MVKIVCNNVIIDVLPQERYLKYQEEQNRFVEVKKYLANAILGSDGNTVYHIKGKTYNFPNAIQSAEVISISESERDNIYANNLLQNSQVDDNLKKEVNDLKDMVTQQNLLIQQLLSKLGNN